MKNKMMLVGFVGLLLIITGCSSSELSYVTDLNALRSVSEPVGKLKDADKQMIANMKTKLNDENLDGLSAPQVGKNVRIILVKDEAKTKVMIDPSIIESKNEQTIIENSPNVPGLHAIVKRSHEIRFEYFDENGNRVKETAKGAYAARVLQQFDYLQGNLFFDNARAIWHQSK